MIRHLASIVAFTLAAQSAVAALLPVHLRCEYLAHPVGIDIARPRLGWVLESIPAGERNRSQSAYRILVASSAAKLLANSGDVWDSGKVASGAQAQIEYAGKPLASARAYFWKVKVWDNDGKPSAWSAPAVWSMGLLERTRWGAKWIFDPAAVVPSDADAKARRSAHSGYCSRMSDRLVENKWAGVDLGSAKTVDAIRLWPAQSEANSPSFLFPRRLRVEIAAAADFADAKVIVDRSTADQPVPPPGTPAEIRFPAVSTRYIRIVKIESPNFKEVAHALALAEMEVLSGGVNVARDAKPLSLDTLENSGWSRAYLTDGRTGFSAGAPPIQPVSVFRKSFQVNGRIRCATAYATARGVYQLRINGKPADDRVLPPEFTDYNKRLQYQTYDVTGELQQGENVLGALVGAGWYAGRVGLYHRHMYGTQPQFLLRLEIELADGKTVTVVSDESWRKDPAPPLVSSDMLDGESYDARRETPGWDRPAFKDTAWQAALADATLGDALLTAQPNEPIRPVMERKPVRITEPRPGVYIFDLGQNMVGWCRLRARGTAGSTVTIRHGEALSEDGTLYTLNLRGARQTDTYTFKGAATESFEPLFLYHGFRFVEVTGLKQRPTLASLTGRVIYSSAPLAGKFETSNRLLNQLMSNILWTQRANMYSIPTDCPQRDERLGWMGDAQTFSQTAIFNMDMAGFYSKWVRDIRDDQVSTGQFPDYAPNPGIGENPPHQVGAPAWGDAGVIVPWRMWQNYADRRLLEEHYDAARRWVEFIYKNNPDGLWNNQRASDYNDWVNGDFVILKGWPTTGAAIPKPIFATAFWAHSTDLLSRMAGVLGKQDDAARYGQLYTQIKAAFNRAWVKPDATIEGGTQSAYALALHFNLLPEELRPAAMKHLVEGFARYNGHLSTGIHATNRLMLELSRGGANDQAYRLATLREFPSWGFMIDNGATTIWERWDGYVKGRGFQNPGMNSLNHWAFGSVGEWMWRTIVGLNPDDDAPGYARFTVRPQPGGGLTSASGEYASIRGPVRIAWSTAAGSISLKVSVPPNSSATVWVPTRDAGAVTEGGRPAAKAPGVKHEHDAVYQIGSGEYEFRAPM